MAQMTGRAWLRGPLPLLQPAMGPLGTPCHPGHGSSCPHGPTCTLKILGRLQAPRTHGPLSQSPEGEQPVALSAGRTPTVGWGILHMFKNYCKSHGIGTAITLSLT